MALRISSASFLHRSCILGKIIRSFVVTERIIRVNCSSYTLSMVRRISGTTVRSLLDLSNWVRAARSVSQLCCSMANCSTVVLWPESSAAFRAASYVATQRVVSSRTSMAGLASAAGRLKKLRTRAATANALFQAWFFRAHSGISKNSAWLIAFSAFQKATC